MEYSKITSCSSRGRVRSVAVSCGRIGSGGSGGSGGVVLLQNVEYSKTVLRNLRGRVESVTIVLVKMNWSESEALDYKKEQERLRLEVLSVCFHLISNL